MFVELFGQEKGADGHGGRLGNEGTEDRSDGHYRKPPRGRRAVAELGSAGHDCFGESKNGAGGGDGHDDHNEGGFDEFAVVAHVKFEGFPVVKADCCGGQGDDPDAEDGFDLAQEVQDGGLKGNVVFGIVLRLGIAGEAKLENLIAVLDFGVVSELVEPTRHKGMGNGKEENQGGDDVEGRSLDARA